MNIFHGYEQNEIREEKDEITIQVKSPLELTESVIGFKNLVQIWAHQPGFAYEDQYVLRDNITNFRIIYAIAIKDNDLGSMTTFTLIPEVLQKAYRDDVTWYMGRNIVIQFSGDDFKVMNVNIPRNSVWSLYCLYGQE